MKIALSATTAMAFLLLAGCENMTETQKTLRDRGRPYLIGESDGLRAYKWEIPTGNSNTEDLVFIVGNSTNHCASSERSSCKTVDASMIGQPVMTEQAVQAMAKLTPEERRALDLTR